MNWPRYAIHLDNEHDLVQSRDSRSYMSLEDTIYVRDLWMTEEKPSPNPRYYDSVNEQEISEFDSESDEISSDDEGLPKIIKLPARIKREEPSSAGSTSEIIYFSWFNS